MKDVVIVSGVRTPIGRYGGTLKDVPVYRLGSLVLNEAVKRAGVKPVEEAATIAIRAVDEAGNIARVSNVALVTASNGDDDDVSDVKSDSDGAEDEQDVCGC